MIKRIEAKFIRLSEAFFYFFVWHSFNFISRVLPFFLIKYKFEGLDNLPRKGRYILAGNHQNFFDGFYIVAPIGPFKKFSFLIAKRALKPKPIEFIWMFITRLINTVVLDDSKDSYQTAIKRLNRILSHGGSIAIFPEGIVSNKNIPRKFKGGVAKLSLDSQTKVVPVYISGTYNLRSIKYCFTRPEVIIRYGKPVELYRYANSSNYDLDKMASILREKVIELSGLKEVDIGEQLPKADSNDIPVYKPGIEGSVQLTSS